MSICTRNGSVVYQDDGIECMKVASGVPVPMLLGRVRSTPQVPALTRPRLGRTCVFPRGGTGSAETMGSG